MEVASSVSFLRGGSSLQPVAVADGAPASGASSSDSLSEAAFLLRDPFNRSLSVTTTAWAELPTLQCTVVWDALVGTGPGGLEAAWLRLQPTACYGIPYPLSLLHLQGEAKTGSEVRGCVGVLDFELKRFVWRVINAAFSGSQGELSLEGQIEGEEGILKHLIEIKDCPEGGCYVSSKLQYSPAPPLQSLLNALGGRQSVVDGNAGMVRRLGVIASSGADFDFDPIPFYNLIGSAIDLMAPIEDDARSRLAVLANLTQPGADLRVLEVGCGTARFARDLITSNGSVSKYVGVDSSETMAFTAAEALSDFNSAAIVCGDSRTPGTLRQVSQLFLGGPPDRVVMNYVLDLMDDSSIDLLIRECQELLEESGGKLALCYICNKGSPVMSAWNAVWTSNPSLVGGCRPIDIVTRLETAGWKVEAQDTVEVLGYSSQIILAAPGI